MLQNKGWSVHAFIVNYWKAHKPVCFVRSYVLSVTQQYKHRTTWKVPIHPAITQNTEHLLVTVKHAPHTSMRKNHNALISAILSSFYNIIAVKSVSAILCLALKPLRAYWIVTYTRLRRKMGAQRVSKAASWCKRCSCCGWRKGTSWDEAMLISEEIKSLALAVLE